MEAVRRHSKKREAIREELLRRGLPGTAREYALTFYGVCDHCQGDSK